MELNETLSDKFESQMKVIFFSVSFYVLLLKETKFLPIRSPFSVTTAGHLGNTDFHTRPF